MEDKASSSAIGSVENHRNREQGAIVYPVFSRRSRGLSVGINLFPDQKTCSFDCPYCEVFPFKADISFSLDTMEETLKTTLAQAADRRLEVRDICFSGNGEPTLSPQFPAALESAARIRDALVPRAALVLITNGTGLLDEGLFHCLRRAAAESPKLNMWLKLDAGTEAWYQKMARSTVPFAEITKKIREFIRLAPVTIQTMLCMVAGKAPPLEETAAWERLIVELAALGRPSALPYTGIDGGRLPGIKNIQLYGKARPAPEDPLAEGLPESYLAERAASLRSALTAAPGGILAGVTIPVEVFP